MIKYLFMGLQVNRDMIIAFIRNELPPETMSLVANAILLDKRLARINKLEKFKIDRQLYNDNKMTPSQRADFESSILMDMKHFVEKASRKDAHSSAELFVKGALENDYMSFEPSRKQNSPSPQLYSINRKLLYWLVAASVAVMLIVGGGVAYHSQTDDSLENRLYANYYTPLSYKDIYVINSSSLNIAKQKYMDGEYVNALYLLKSLPSSITIEVEKDLFIGMSLMEIGKQKEAAEYFEGILANQGKLDYIPKVRWYLGLCYLKMGNKEKSIETFQIIVNSNDDYYKKAKRILKKLSD